MFWRGCTGQSERGPGLSLPGVVDLQPNTAYALDAQQALGNKGKTRADLHAEQVLKEADFRSTPPAHRFNDTNRYSHTKTTFQSTLHAFSISCK